MKTLIANGYLIDPSQGINTGGKHLLLENGRVAGIVNRDEAWPEDAEVFDATGLLVAPGFIDMHVHLREPGQEYKETIASGAAAVTGITQGKITQCLFGKCAFIAGALAWLEYTHQAKELLNSSIQPKAYSSSNKSD